MTNTALGETTPALDPSTSAGSGTATSAFVPKATWTWQGHDSDGYAAFTKVQAGKAVREADVALLPGFSNAAEISSGCNGFDSESYGVVPMLLTMTNTTHNFTSDLEMTAEDIGPTQWAADIGGSISCGMAPLTFNCNLNSGQSCTTSVYLIIAGFFSPNAPNGSGSSEVSFYESPTSGGGPLTASHVRGPGAQNVNSANPSVQVSVS